MPDLTTILMLASLPPLLAACAFFSGSETALFSLTHHQRRHITRGGSLVDRRLAALLGQSRQLLITLLLGNMAGNVLFFVISTVMMLRLKSEHRAGAMALAAVSLASLLAMVLLGEVLPKMVASRMTLVTARLAAIPLTLVHRFIDPIRLTLSVLVVTPLARLIAPREGPLGLSPDELESLLEMSQTHGLIDAGEEQLLQQVLALGQLKVRDLMRPRVDIVAFNLAHHPAELIAVMTATLLSRIIVYERDLDHIVGFAHARQVLHRRPQSRQDLAPLIRQVMYVPEMQRADRLLLELRKAGTTMAVAVDEYGGTAGLITLEDVVEHLVGQIVGRYEGGGPPAVEPLEPGKWRVGAELSVHEWASAFGPIGPAQGVSTVGGLVMAKLGRLPKPGDTARVGNLTLLVESMDGRRLKSLLLQLTPAPGSSGTPGPGRASPAEATDKR